MWSRSFNQQMGYHSSPLCKGKIIFETFVFARFCFTFLELYNHLLFFMPFYSGSSETVFFLKILVKIPCIKEHPLFKLFGLPVGWSCFMKPKCFMEVSWSILDFSFFNQLFNFSMPVCPSMIFLCFASYGYCHPCLI